MMLQDLTDTSLRSDQSGCWLPPCLLSGNTRVAQCLSCQLVLMSGTATDNRLFAFIALPPQSIYIYMQYMWRDRSMQIRTNFSLPVKILLTFQSLSWKTYSLGVSIPFSLTRRDQSTSFRVTRCELKTLCDVFPWIFSSILLNHFFMETYLIYIVY